jgi:PAS domain S-box-containing protein
MPDDITRAQALGLPGNLDWNDGAARQHLIRLEQVIRAIASPVIVTDKEGVTVWVNAAFTQTTGYEMDEAVGITPGQLLQGPDTDRREAARVGAALRSRRSVAAELINYAKDGRRYWIGMKIHPLMASWRSRLTSRIDTSAKGKWSSSLADSGWRRGQRAWAFLSVMPTGKSPGGAQ